MQFITYSDAIVTQHFTGIVHRGRPVLGVEIVMLPTKDRAFGILIGSRWIGWYHGAST
jgi:hypothetical protein